MASLTIAPGDPAETTIVLAEQLVIGRSSRADVSLDDSAVSQIHALLTLRRGKYYVTDQNSTNGTQVNGRAVLQPTPLSHLDVLRVGASEVQFVDPPLDPSGLDVVEDSDPGPMGTVVADVDTTDPISGLLSLNGEGQQEVQKLRRRLEIFYRVAWSIIEAPAELPLLRTVLSQLFEALPSAERGVVLLKDEEMGLTPCLSTDRNGIDITVPVSRTMIAHAIQSGRGILTLDPVEDARFSETTTVLELRMRTILCVPFLVGDEVYGVVQLDSSGKSSPFNKEDLELVAGIGCQVAMALANRRLQTQVLKQELMQKDLLLARKVQQQFLPDKTPDWPPFDFALRYEPALEVGGDYYDFLTLANNGLAVVVGDVAGKGISAALFMAKVSSEARFVAARHHDPGAILTELNQVLCNLVSEGMFMTMAIVTLDGDTCRFASAGHLPPILRRASGEVEVFRGLEGVALGVDENACYEVRTTGFTDGDCLLLLTDGVTEAQSPTGDFFGEARLLECVSESPTNPGSIVSDLHQSVQQFQAGSLAYDDLTMVAVGQTGRAT